MSGGLNRVILALVCPKIDMYDAYGVIACDICYKRWCDDEYYSIYGNLFKDVMFIILLRKCKRYV